MKTDHLLFGAAYYSEYLPYDRVEKDMEMMEKAFRHRTAERIFLFQKRMPFRSMEKQPLLREHRKKPDISGGTKALVQWRG